MSAIESSLLGFAAALGGGLLIGIERERRKGTGPGRALAGVRTFALASVAGAGATAAGEPLLVVAGAVLIAALVSIAYWRNRSRDPGVTTELALLVTYLLGVLAIGNPALTAGGSVVVTALLASRRTLHEFSVDTLRESELRDGLVFAASALVLLPLLPDTPLSWVAGVNPRRLWGLVVLFMLVQAAGYVALRGAGARMGLALSGLAAGFVSSTGTIAALGTRARDTPSLRISCVAGALFSTVATVVLLAIVVLAVWRPAFASLAPSLGGALIGAVAVATLGLWRQQKTASPAAPVGRAFNLLYAIGFAAGLTAVTALVSLAATYFGSAGATSATALAGAFDVHAAATSILSLGAGGKVPVAAVRLPILIAFSANTASKVVAAYVGGGVAYGTEVAIGLLITLAGAWAPLLIPG